MLRVVHINVRLYEGGAATIALDLHRRSLKAGIDSKYFYGYSFHAKRANNEKTILGAIHLGTRASVILNYFSHKLVGLEFFAPLGSKANHLRDAILKADVVHLHVIHSYYLPLEWLSYILKEAKKVVWTCHDFWPITGRCGFLEGCDGWKKGCGSCGAGLNYPPAIFDFSAYSFKKKREQINRFIERTIFVAPSKFVSEKVRTAFPSARVETVYNGIDSDLEIAASLGIVDPSNNQDEIVRLLVMANDLSDPTKIDRQLVLKVLSLPGVEMHTIGRNSPFLHSSVINHGEISSRVDLAAIMQRMHALLFTSMKDTFGLVMVESMVCGTPVLALPSEAASEVLGLVGQQTLTKQQIIHILTDQSDRVEFLDDLKKKLTESQLSIFSGQNMFKNYLKLYSSI